MDVRVGLWRRLSTEELMLLNCGVGEDSWESLGLQEDSTSPFWRRSALGFLWREWCWSWNSSTLATSCEELTHWKRLWCCEGLGAGGEGDNRGWEGWMASLTRWTWVWVNSRSWWWTGRPGMLQFMGSQRFGQDWATDLIWSDLKEKVSVGGSGSCFLWTNDYLEYIQDIVVTLGMQQFLADSLLIFLVMLPLSVPKFFHDSVFPALLFSLLLNINLVPSLFPHFPSLFIYILSFGLIPTLIFQYSASISLISIF